MDNPQIILASRSPYRRQLLENLGLKFHSHLPHIDEELLKAKFLKEGCSPSELSIKLARAKAQSLRTTHPHALIIGSDQVASLDEQILSKAHSLEECREQLSKLTGHTHHLSTAVSVFYQDHQIDHLDICRLTMRHLTPSDIETYIHKDRPTGCAGSYKLERAGIALFSKIECSDHSSIIGLPLIGLCDIFWKLNIRPFESERHST